MFSPLTIPITIPQAAKALEVSECTVRRWIGKGCPVVREGTQGRGCTTLLNLDAVKAWRGSGSGGFSADHVSELAAAGAWRTLQMTDDPRLKRALAEWFTKSWYFTAAAAYEIEERWEEPAEPEHIKHMRGMCENTQNKA